MPPQISTIKMDRPPLWTTRLITLDDDRGFLERSSAAFDVRIFEVELDRLPAQNLSVYFPRGFGMSMVNGSPSASASDE